jgi:membrane protein YqaA with SNARE-associated domain
VQQLLVDYGPYAGTFLLAFISGFVPLVLVDGLLVAVALKTTANLPLVVLLAATATLASKLPIYYGVRGLLAAPRPGSKHAERIERMRRWIGRFDRYPAIVLACSSVVGLPPFSIVATVAGAFDVKPRTFAAIVWFGRLVRFTAVVALARAYRS